MNRPKMGFSIPISKWLNEELKMYVDKYLSETFLKEQNIFHHAEINRILNSFYTTKAESAEKIWYLLMFQMWYDKWINNN